MSHFSSEFTSTANNAPSPLYNFVAGILGFRSLFNAGDRHGQQLKAIYDDAREGPSGVGRGCFWSDRVAREGGAAPFPDADFPELSGGGPDIGDDCDDYDEDEYDKYNEWHKMAREEINAREETERFYDEEVLSPKESRLLQSGLTNKPRNLAAERRQEWDEWLQGSASDSGPVKKHAPQSWYDFWDQHCKSRDVGNDRHGEKQKSRVNHLDSSPDLFQNVACDHFDNCECSLVGRSLSKPSRNNLTLPCQEMDGSVSYPDVLPIIMISPYSPLHVLTLPGFRNIRIAQFQDMISADSGPQMLFAIGTTASMDNLLLWTKHCHPEFWSSERGVSREERPLSEWPPRPRGLDMYEALEEASDLSVLRENESSSNRVGEFWRVNSLPHHVSGSNECLEGKCEMPAKFVSIIKTIDTRSQRNGSVSQRTVLRRIKSDGTEEVLENFEKSSLLPLLADQIQAKVFLEPGKPNEASLEVQNFRARRGWFWANED